MAFDVRSKTTATGVGTAVALTVPAGTVSTDGLFAFIAHDAGVQITPPSGWALVSSVFNADTTLRLLEFTGNPTTGPWSFTLSATSEYAGTAIAVQRDPAGGARVPAPDVSASLVVASTTAAAAPPVVTPNTTGDLVLYAVAWGRGSAFVPPGGVTEQVDINTGATASDKTLWVGSQANSTTAGVATTAISVTNSNPNGLSAAEYSIVTIAIQSSPPPSTWVGDFETTNVMTQYAFYQAAASDRVELRTDSPRQGTKYARFTTQDSDVYPLTPNNDPRAQLVSPRYLFSGTERWISWSTRFPTAFPRIPYNGWLVFFQIHGPPYAGSPTIAFGTSGDTVNFERNVSYNFDTAWSAPLVRNAWQDFVLRVNLATDTTGFVELWFNGVPQVFHNGRRRLYMKTIEPDQVSGVEIDPTLYLKKGQVSSISLDHDSVRFDSTAPASLASVLQGTPPIAVVGTYARVV